MLNQEIEVSKELSFYRESLNGLCVTAHMVEKFSLNTWPSCLLCSLTLSGVAASTCKAKRTILHDSVLYVRTKNTTGDWYRMQTPENEDDHVLVKAVYDMPADDEDTCRRSNTIRMLTSSTTLGPSRNLAR